MPSQLKIENNDKLEYSSRSHDVKSAIVLQANIQNPNTDLIEQHRKLCEKVQLQEGIISHFKQLSSHGLKK